MMNESLDVLDPSVLNNQGVLCLADGRNQEAVQCFKHALVTMKASLYQLPAHLKLPSLVRPRPLYSSVNMPTNEERFYICARALEFPSTDGAIEERDYPLYSALILSNIGLAYHLRSQESDVEERSLSDAAYFYSMSMQILKSIQPHCKKSVIAPVKLAALNNLATVYYQQGVAQRAHEILGEAYELLSPALLLLSEESNAESAFDQGDFDGITLNAVMMKWTFVAPCA